MHKAIHVNVNDATAGGVEQGPANAQNCLAMALPISLSAEVHSDPAPATHCTTHDVHHPLHHHSAADELGVRKTQRAIVHGSHPTYGQHIQEENRQADQDGAAAQCQVQTGAHGSTA